MGRKQKMHGEGKKDENNKIVALFTQHSETMFRGAGRVNGQPKRATQLN